MRIPRLYLNQPLTAPGRIVVSGDRHNYLCRVLRLRSGGHVTLFNGDGCDYPATLGHERRDGVELEIGAALPRSIESPLRITLLQGISKGDRMDYTLQKGVELGVAQFVPLTMVRSVVQLDGERAERRLNHWRGIVISACEQSGRNLLPEVTPITTLAAWLACHCEQGIYLDPLADQPLSCITPRTNTLHLIIGPEGGMDERERQLLRDHGWQGVSLGPRILRTETAGLAAIAIVQGLYGDMDRSTANCQLTTDN
jgi:16S rRNA (uracil1498-N3)-methyltransferase